MAEDLPTLVDNFVVDLPKFEKTTAVLPDEWEIKVERASHLISGGSYLESARTSTALVYEAEVAYPVALESLYKATACAGYMVEALRLARAASLDTQARELTTAATSPEQLTAYLTRLSGNSEYQPRRPSTVMIAEITLKEGTGAAAAIEAEANKQLGSGNAADAIQGFLQALSIGYPTETAKAQAMVGLGKAYDLCDDRDRAIDWYRKAVDSGYLEGAPFIDAAVRMATGMLARGQNYTAIHWLSKAADAGDKDAAFKAGSLLVTLERPMMAADMLRPLAEAGNAEAQKILDQLPG